VIRRLDRYVINEYLGPFVFGVGTFVVILLGAQLVPWMLRLLVRDAYPASIVLRIFVYRLPAALGLTFPMATVFASLMCMSSLSSSGEVIALRAGGLSIPRLSAAILAAGFVTSVLALSFNELLVPYSSHAAQELIAGYAPKARPLEYFTFAIPAKGEPQRIVNARLFDPKQQRLEGLTILEMKNGRFWQLFSAESADWRGETWELRNVEHVLTRPDGSQSSQKIASITHEIGKSPLDLADLDTDPVDMSMAELHRELGNRRKVSPPESAEVLLVLMTIHLRWAIPWASLGFALIGIPLGLRPTRATTSIGLGLSLIIVFAYYVLFNTMSVAGNQGALPVVAAAWLPNVVLFGTGLGLFSTMRR
jgi:lipopolysaccharide export system permease protein